MRMQEIIAALPEIGELTRDVTVESLGDTAADRPSMLAFAESPRFAADAVGNPRVVCIVTTPELAHQMELTCPLLLTSNPRESFFSIHNYLAEHTTFYWTDFPSDISSGATIHETAFVAPRNVRIGRGTIIEPHAVVLERSVIGEDVILRAGAVIGGQGFEFKRFGQRVFPVAHAGGVRLCDRVEIQVNSTVDRSVCGGFTEVGEDTKVDNLVYIAHAARIGKRCLIAAGAKITGSAEIGDDVWIGPGACISDHVKVGAQAKITLGAVVVHDVGPGQRVTGNFAVAHAEFKKEWERIKFSK